MSTPDVASSFLPAARVVGDPQIVQEARDRLRRSGIPAVVDASGVVRVAREDLDDARNVIATLHRTAADLPVRRGDGDGDGDPTTSRIPDSGSGLPESDGLSAADITSAADSTAIPDAAAAPDSALSDAAGTPAEGVASEPGDTDAEFARLVEQLGLDELDDPVGLTRSRRRTRATDPDPDDPDDDIDPDDGFDPDGVAEQVRAALAADDLPLLADEHYVAPAPAPLPRPKVRTVSALLILLAGILLLMMGARIGIDPDASTMLGLLAIVSSAVILGLGLRDHREDDGDDGARL